MRYLYHSTPYENLYKILDKGLLPGRDGLIYLCETPQNCNKFLIIRGFVKLLTVRVKVPKKLENTIIETFDHSEEFFKCRAFASRIPIPLDRIDKFTVWEL